MKQLLQSLIVGATAVVAGAAIADVTLFDNEHYVGREFNINQMTPNLEPLGFNDRAQSAIVRDTSWEFCVDAGFNGSCTVLPPGRYPSLGALSSKLSSARPVGGVPGAVSSAGSPPATLPPIGTVTFYENENFGGRQFRLDQMIPNFAGRYNDRARSMVVESGSWEVCVDADFRGDCRIFIPGRYPTLAGLGARVSSVRPAYDAAYGTREWRDAPPGARHEGPAGRHASATLFSGPNFTGRSFPLTSEGASNFYGMFNDRASSLRVDRGYWIFCSDANFSGECRTFGPGEYPYLPAELNNRISSGRRISNDYPYAAAPNWRY